MSALVAYCGSGSSSEDEDDSGSETGQGSQVSGAGVQAKTQNSAAVAPPSGPSSSSSGKSVIFSKFVDDEDDYMEGEHNGDDDEGLEDNVVNDENPIWSKYLPQPKKVEGVEEEEDVEIGPIPPKKVYGDEELVPSKPSTSTAAGKRVQGKVKISIPFLNTLDEDPQEDAEKRKIINPAKKGSGLFAILPQPKNSPLASDVFSKKLSNPSSVPVVQAGGSSSSAEIEIQHTRPSPSMNRLIPDAVKNKLKRTAVERGDEIRAKFSKKARQGSVSSAKPGKECKDSDDSDNEGPGDFFSLDSSEVADPEALEKLKLPMPDFQSKQQIEETTEEMETEDYDQTYHQQASSSRSDDLMKFIQPKKGRKEEVNIIDINADDLRPDNTEWLKNITDESAAPARRGKGLGGMVKRKHQITYLAFEAKAREQELKNQWAQNRANKMATNNKYGF